MTNKKQTMDWKIWGKKVAVTFIVGGIVSLISMLEVVPIDPTQAFYMTVVLGSLRAISNYLKHRT